MGVFEIVVEPNVRRRRNRRPLAGTKRAAALFRILHGVRDLIGEAEEKATVLTAGTTAFGQVDTSLPN